MLKNITNKYLDINNQYEIFRDTSQGNIFAKDISTENCVILWDKSSALDSEEELGHGQFGTVYQKTETKAFKKFKSEDIDNQTYDLIYLDEGLSNSIVSSDQDSNSLSEHEKNLLLIKQKFDMQQEGIDAFFVTGLHHKTKKIFNMPVASKVVEKQSGNMNAYDALYIFNTKLGYYHTDLADNPFHSSPQNILAIDGKNVFVDMDEVGVIGRTNKDIRMKDQWLWFKNRSNEEIRAYYNKNKTKALSDNLIDLFNIVKKCENTENRILLPAKLEDQYVLFNTLNDAGIDFKDDWDNLKNNETLQKAIIVAYESGVEINTNTVDFLNKNASVKDILAQSYDHIESMDTPSESKAAFQKEARTHRNELVEHIIKDSVKHSENDATQSGAYPQLTRLNNLVGKANNKKLTNNTFAIMKQF